MGERGPAKTPTALKLIAGTDRPCRREEEDGVTLPAIETCPEAPFWMACPFARAEWKRLATILSANRMLTEAGLAPLAVLCSVYGEIVDTYVNGEKPPTRLIAAYRALVNDFGLTPVAQGKVKPLGEKDSGNRFGNNGRRPS